MKRITFCAVTMVLGISVGAQSQSTTGTGLSDAIPTVSQTITANDLSSWTSWNPTTAGNLLPDDPIQSFGTVGTYFTPSLTTSGIVVVHIVNSVDTAATNAISIHDSSWFIFRLGRDGKFHNVLTPSKSAKVAANGVTAGSEPSLYGITNGYLVTLSRLQVDQSRAWPNLPPYPVDPPNITYTITPTLGTPANKAAAQMLFNAVLGISTGSGQGGEQGRTLSIQPPKYMISVTITKLSSATLKPPYTLAISGTPVGTGPDNGTCQNVTAKTTCTLAQTLTVSDIEHWGIGANIVAWGPLERKYSLSSSDAVTMTSTRHEAIYGTFDFSPWAASCPMTKCPYVQVGLPLSGAVLHLPYTGIAWGLPFTASFLQMSAYGGVGFMRQTKLNGIAAGSTTTQTLFNAAQQTDWPRKAIFGVEVSVSSIVSKIKSSVGGGGKGGSGGT